MRQLLQNLLHNAIKFRRPQEPPRIDVYAHSLTGTTAGETIYELTVKDNGIGFDLKFADRIFTIFQRLHGRDEYEGTGVGFRHLPQNRRAPSGAYQGRQHAGRRGHIYHHAASAPVQKPNSGARSSSRRATHRINSQEVFVLDGRNRKDIQPGQTVYIVLKQDQRSGAQTKGVVKDILTRSAHHPHGIKVRLEDGQVGRVQEIEG